MDINTLVSPCFFCNENIQLKHPGVFHTFKPDHGPFDIYSCSSCGSCQTFPNPSPESLTSLYGSYFDGLPNLHRTIMEDDPQTALYKQCVNHIRRLSGRDSRSEFSWLDVGGGGGELCALMAKEFPASKGMGVDLHASPKMLAELPSVDWRQVDINEKEFSTKLAQVDLVMSIAVWEHVLRPDLYVANLLRLVRPGGMLYLLCPNNGSWASRLLGRRWPYFTPGEHLAMPTPAGAVRCLQREWDAISVSKEKVKIKSKPVMMPYTFRYVLRRLGIDAIGKLLPPGWGIPLPAGALEAVLIRP